MKKIILRFVVTATVLFVIVALAAVWLLRASLPQVDGEVLAPGLTGAATIARDVAGVPVITAVTRLDLAFATGFAHGQDRFFQMDTIRRNAAGELSELVGELAIGLDKRNRFHRFRTRARAVLAASPKDEAAILQRYADGVNAGLADLGARPFEYFVLGVKPQPWLPEDSVLVVYTMFMQLNDSRAVKEVQRGFAHSVLPADVYAWMYPPGTPWDAPIIGAPHDAARIPGPESFSLRGVPDTVTPANEYDDPPIPGSNNWAVSGALTESGRALVSNDMHLGHSVPNVYYRARLIVTGDQAREVSGVTLPGAPFVVAGSNTMVAWGYTNSYGDYTDAVVLQPGASPGTYKTPNGDLPFERHEESIKVKGGDAVAYSIRETIWGPVRDDLDYPDGEIAVSWIAHRPVAVNLQLIKLETASTVFEALDIANTIGMPPQNFVSGDANGDIGWTIAGKIPTRTAFDALLPADWSQEEGWTGWLSPGDYPRIINPESGRLWTANARVVSGATLQIIGDGGYDLGARAKQIRDRLFAQGTFSAEDMLKIQYDDRALFLMPWRDLLLNVLNKAAIGDDVKLAEYQRLVADWIPAADPDSVGYRFVRAFRLEVKRRLFHALMTPVRVTHGEDVKLRVSNQFEAALWSLVTQRPQHMLPGDYMDWDAFLLAVVRQNIEYFTTNFEGVLADRTWGEVNTAAIRHPLSGGIPLLGNYLNMPDDTLNGDSNMPKAQGPSFGASERFSVFPGDEANSLFQMPTGQSGHPLSPYYREGHVDWVRGTPGPFLPGVAQHTLTLSPN
jgi:penicillin amidase